MTMVGEELGDRYRLDALIGAGGMATVYRAWDSRLERAVAVKLLSPNLAADPTLAARFEQEARFLAAVSHPAIVAVHDVGETGSGDPWFVMELVEGETLAERLERQARLAPPEAVPIVARVAEGLSVLHQRGFIHRDVKPHNILLTESGGAKLADFGLVRSDDVTSELTAPGTTVGTLAYLAPELLAGGPATPASDVYALAVVAYRALTGRPPFQAQALGELVEAQAGPITKPSEVVSELGESFDEALLAGLADGGRRPDATGLADALTTGLDAWTARSAPAAATVAVPAAVSAPDPSEETTVVPVGEAAAAGAAGTVAAGAGVAGPTSATLPRTGWQDRRRAARSRTADGERRGRLLAAWVVGGAAILAAVAILFALTGAFDRRPGTSGAGASGTRPSPTASLTRSPTRPPDPFQGVLTAVSDYRKALDAATGGREGLKGKEAGDLKELADRVEAAARDTDAEGVRDRADELRTKTEETVKKEGLESDATAALVAAARRVADAAGKVDEGD